MNTTDAILADALREAAGLDTPAVSTGMGTKFPRSAPILERFKASAEPPTNSEKAKFWYAYARDIVTGKSTATQIVAALAHGTWALAKARKAEQRAEDLERRLIALERRVESERKGFFYRGTYAEGEAYEPQDFVTCGGSLWHCNEATTARPGTCDAWQLAVKAGRDRRR